MQQLQTLDYVVFLLLLHFSLRLRLLDLSAEENQKLNLQKDFFLAEGSLTWWAIGASLIASNISAEQFIGMSGNGFSMGLGISTYEWMAAATLVIVAVFFCPLTSKTRFIPCRSF